MYIQFSANHILLKSDNNQKLHIAQQVAQQTTQVFITSSLLYLQNYHLSIHIRAMQPTKIQPQSPFLKFVPQTEQTHFTKKIASILQTDKENVTVASPKIEVNKMQIGEDEVDEYLIEMGELLRLKKENVRELFKGLEKENSPKRVVIGLLGHKSHQAQKAKHILGQKPTNQQKDQVLLNLNILIKLRPQQSPYISMFTCNCLMEVLKLYLKKTEFKEEDLSLRWKYAFFLENQKIGEVLVWNDVKGDELYANIAIRMRLGMITKSQREFVAELLQEFGSRLNISKNLRQTAYKINQLYQSSLMFLGEQVIIKRRQPNQWQDVVSGKFIRVNEIGHAILEGEEGNEEDIEDGYMELKGEGEELSPEEGEEEEAHLEGIGI